MSNDNHRRSADTRTSRPFPRDDGRRYYTDPPPNCDICAAPFGDTMYDALLVIHQWANVCPVCFGIHGVGLGTGRGQRYQRQPKGQPDAGRWLKIKG